MVSLVHLVFSSARGASVPRTWSWQAKGRRLTAKIVRKLIPVGLAGPVALGHKCSGVQLYSAWTSRHSDAFFCHIRQAAQRSIKNIESNVPHYHTVAEL